MKFKVFSVGKIDRREALEKYLDDSDANIQSWPTADDGKALADKDGGMFTVAFVKAGTTYIAEIYSRAEAEAESLFADAFDAAGPKAKRIALDAASDEALDSAMSQKFTVKKIKDSEDASNAIDALELVRLPVPRGGRTKLHPAGKLTINGKTTQASRVSTGSFDAFVFQIGGKGVWYLVSYTGFDNANDAFDVLDELIEGWGNPLKEGTYGPEMDGVALDFATATINTRAIEGEFEEAEEALTAAGWGKKAGVIQAARNLGSNTAIDEAWHSKDKRYWIFRIGAEWYAAEATGFGETDPVNTLAMINRTKPKLGKYVLDSVQEPMSLKALSAKLDAITEWAECRGFEMPALDGARTYEFDVKASDKASYKDVLNQADTSLPATRYAGIDNDANAMGIQDGKTHYVAIKKNGKFLLVTIHSASTEHVAAQVINEAWAKLRPANGTKKVEVFLDATSDLQTVTLDSARAYEFDVKDSGKTSYREALAGVDTQIPATRFTKIENDPNAMGISDGGTHYVAVKKNGKFLLVTVYGASTEYVASQVINEAWAKKLRPGKATKEVEIYLDAIMTDAGDIKSPMWATSLDREYKAAMLDGVQFKKDGADVFVNGAYGVAVLDGATFVTFTNEAGETFDEQNIVLDGILGK